MYKRLPYGAFNRIPKADNALWDRAPLDPAPSGPSVVDREFGPGQAMMAPEPAPQALVLRFELRFEMV